MASVVLPVNRKFQPTPSRNRAAVKCMISWPDSAMPTHTRLSTTPDQHHRQGAQALDQVAGEEAGGEHADHMPFEHQRGRVETESAHLHGQRRGSHQQVHHPIAEGRTEHRHGKSGLAQQFPRERPAGGAALPAQGRLDSKRTAAMQAMDNKATSIQRDVGTGKRHGKQRARAAGQVGARHRTQQPARRTSDTAFSRNAGAASSAAANDRAGRWRCSTLPPPWPHTAARNWH